MSEITGLPFIGSRSNLLLVSGTDPVSIEANTYDTVISSGTDTAVVTLPAIADVAHGTVMSFRAGGTSVMTVTGSGANVGVAATASVNGANNNYLQIIADKVTAPNVWQIIQGPGSLTVV